jgi:hypothetical protein
VKTNDDENVCFLFSRPEGTFDNSPAFQCRVDVIKMLSPEGAVESVDHVDMVQPSLRDFVYFDRIPGIEMPGYFQLSPSGSGLKGLVNIPWRQEF